MEQVIAGLGNRVFLMRNVHDDAPVVFQTRWAMSYLRGPMTIPQLKLLAAPASAVTPVAAQDPKPAAAARPVVPPELPEYFLRPRNPASDVAYRASAVGVSKLHFVDAKAGLDTWMTYAHLAPVGDDGFAVWEEAEPLEDFKGSVDRQPIAGARFAEVPPAALRKQNAAAWQKTLVSHLYQQVALELWSCHAFKLTSTPGETESAFHVRVAQSLRERRDLEVEKLKSKYAPKLQTLADQIRRAEDRVEREKAQASQQKMTAAVSFGATILGALMGRRVFSAGTVSRAASSVRSASRVGKEKADVERAGEGLDVLKERMQALEVLFEQDVAALETGVDPAAAGVVRTRVSPRKADITIGAVGICWRPWRTGADGLLEPA
jgi:hypothetical protein